ncbi:MAG TPA: ABC transporter substrate-binding protein [Cyclobacteriaceae bacterium]|jgi:putative glutamine transport system substrate-binding protein|nr:ABC transporter substrate-binding protein [Cyclobacteriaceae bacterium]
MKKLYSLVVLCLLALTNVFSQNYAGDSWAQVKKKGEGKISLAYVESFGFVYKDNGKLTGICVDIMNDFVQYVNEKKNVKLTYDFVGDGESFKEMYDKVKASSGGVFGLGNITITDERKREVKFSPPFITNLAFLVTSNDVATLAKMEDLPTTFGKLTAYTAKGTLNEKRINELKQKYYPNMKITLTANSQETLEKITSGTDGFAYLDLGFYLEAVQQRKPLKRHPIGDKASEQFGFIMPSNSDWSPLLDEFFKANGGYINGLAYKSILRKDLGETGMKLLQATAK